MSEDREEYKTETPMGQSDLEQCVIKPCPFCGDQPEVYVGEMQITIRCTNCLKEHRCIEFSLIHATPEESVEAWNKRAL